MYFKTVLLNFNVIFYFFAVIDTINITKSSTNLSRFICTKINNYYCFQSHLLNRFIVLIFEKQKNAIPS